MNTELVWSPEQSYVPRQWPSRCGHALARSGRVESPIADVFDLARKKDVVSMVELDCFGP